jgi:hypothetical protein
MQVEEALSSLARAYLPSQGIRTLIRSQQEYEADVECDTISTAAPRISSNDTLTDCGKDAEVSGFHTLTLVVRLTSKYDSARFPNRSLHMAPGIRGRDDLVRLQAHGSWPAERPVVFIASHSHCASAAFQKVIANRQGAAWTPAPEIL